MNNFSYLQLERDVIEEAALDAVCACRYYDLADYLQITSNSELLAIIDGTNKCNRCN